MDNNKATACFIKKSKACFVKREQELVKKWGKRKSWISVSIYRIVIFLENFDKEEMLKT